MRVPIRPGLCAVIAMFALTGVAASPALAGEAHPKIGEFGSFSNPNGIAVDSASGDVYVADIGTDTVYKFDASGNPVDFSALGSNALTGSATPAESFLFPNVYGNPAALAVDNACVLHTPALSGAACTQFDPSAGDLYVMDEGHEVIDKFAPSGAYLGQITGPTPEKFSHVHGVGVDASGNVRAFAPSGIGYTPIDVFDNSAANNFVRALQDTAVPPPPREGERGFAVGATGDGYGLFGSGCNCVERFGNTMEAFGQVDNNSTGAAVAVDQATGHVYIDDQSFVAEWDPGEMNGQTYQNEQESVVSEETSSGTLVSSFGSGELAVGLGEPQGGIAVNSVTGNVYVSNPADGKVYVFGTAVPRVAAALATGVTQTGATLNGAVDPHRSPVTSCEFEYGTVTISGHNGGLTGTGSYEHSVACVPGAAEIGSGMSPVPVSADIPGPGEPPLQPGLLYHFRLQAGNAAGAGVSTGLFATAGSGFGVNEFKVAFLNKDGTPDTQAGSHPYEMTTTIGLNTAVVPREAVGEATYDSRYFIAPDGNLKDVITHLPAGFFGNPSATGKMCTLKEMNPEFGEKTFEEVIYGPTCPADSRIGELEVILPNDDGENTVHEPVFNITQPPGVAAQFGAHITIPDVYIEVTVPAGGDYGVMADVSNAPITVPTIATKLTLFGGVPPGSETGKPFLTLPTSCNGPLTSTISVDSYQEPGHFVGKSSVSPALGGCSKLLFPPTISVSPDVPDASTSTGLTVGVHVSQKAALNPEGLAESTLRDTTVALPAGVAINPAGADGLEACSEGLVGFTGFSEFNPGGEPGAKTATFTPELVSSLQPGVGFCPNGAKIATVKIKTPLLPNALEGAVYLAAQNANPFGSLVAMYLVAEDPVSGTLIKLPGEVQLSETGQIVTTFKNTPELPFEDLELHFFGGERAPLTTPSRCGTYTTQASFVPWDGNAPVDTSSSFQITAGPNGSPCPGASLPFAPSLTAGTTNIQAGAFSPFTMTMSREDGQQNLQAISLKMPPGLSGLLSGVELCPEPQADQGTCAPASQIGETIVSVGVGDKPFSVKGGRVYMTGPYEGAPFGLSIVNPAKAGPYDLEAGTPCDCVVVRAKIEVDPHTAALTITSDNTGPYKIPTILKGIPLQIQHVNVTINRPGFTFNPTNCNPMSITGSLSSTEGATSALSVPLQATNCAVLGFKPAFKVSTSGKTSRSKGASLSVKLTYPKAPFGSQANIRSVKVDLPKQLPSRLTTLQKACTAAQFNTNPAGCPAASVLGHAKAITPLIPVPLEGPAYFVSHGGEAFPSLIVVLQGYGVRIDLVGTTFISKAGITSSTFKTVPDAPVGSFELTLPEGKYSALAANGNLCTSKLAMPTAFVAQNGAEIHESTPIGVTGCSTGISIVSHKINGRTLTVAVSVPAAGRVTASGNGLSRSSKSAKGRETLTFKLTQKKPGKLSTKLKIAFKPSKGGKQAKSLSVKFKK